jgi:hypothetical protein
MTAKSNADNSYSDAIDDEEDLEALQGHFEDA